MKITKKYLQNLIKEEIQAELEQEGKAGAGLAAGLAIFSAMAGMSAKQQIDRLQQLNKIAAMEYENVGYPELAQIYEKATGNSAEEDRMDLEDLKLFAAGQKFKK